MVHRKIKEGMEIYACDKCGEELTEVNKDNLEGIWFHECPHYLWEVVSNTCYNNEYPECDPQYIRYVKKTYVLKAYSGFDVYLLLQKTQ